MRLLEPPSEPSWVQPLETLWAPRSVSQTDSHLERPSARLLALPLAPLSVLHSETPSEPW